MAGGPIGGGTSTGVVYTTYTASGIIFAKATEANIAVANTIDALDDSLTDVFSPVTLATGKITSAATNSPVIQGTATDFLTDFSVDDYLFYYTASASPVLLGRILSVDSETQITLTEDSPVAISAVPAYCGKTNTVISASEDIIMRIPVVPISTLASGVISQIAMPYWNGYRTPPAQPSSNNLTSASSMASYSQINNPSQITNSPVNVPYTITAIYNYPITPGANTVFATADLFPNYAYALLNPNGNSSVQLAANTLYKMFANESFQNNGIVVNANYPFSNLKSAGY
jgi:hypothetical protein